MRINLICSISDVHVEKSQDEKYKLLLKFMASGEVKNSKYIIFLGDIFDLMIGDHEQYSIEFSDFFLKVRKLLDAGKVVYYFEGNHDFHLNKFFDSLSSDYPQSFFYSSTDQIINIYKKFIYLGHGDDIEIDNWTYKIYKKLVRNPFMNLMANYLVPYSFVNYIGIKASESSRKRNLSRYSDDQERKKNEILEKFRKSADKVKDNNQEISFLLAGHSHVMDVYDSSLGYVYLNNGYFPLTKSFIHINSDFKFHFVNVD